MRFYKSFNKNIEYLKNNMQSDDLVFLPVKHKSKTAMLIFYKELTDKKAVGELIIKPLLDAKTKNSSVFDVFLSPEKKKISALSDIPDEVTDGNTVILFPDNTCLSFGLKNIEKRAITEPPTSAVIKGPREGFVENISTNVSLLRRRIKNADLKFINLEVGEYSKTAISVCYIDGIADKKLVDVIVKKIQAISIDAVIDSSYIAKFLGEHKTSLFKQLGNTEKPDILSAKLLEGRIGIIVDGSPIVLTLPYILIEDFQSPSDYYSSPYSATLARIIRTISVFVSIYLPAFFVASELFHLQLIPLSFLLTIVNSIKGIPLSPSIEMFFTLLIFEILNEASVRMPKYVGMVVSIVGGLVLGETAVEAGIISAPTLMIVAFSGICLYTVPELEQIFSIIRFVLLVVAGSLGGFGLICISLVLIIYTVSFTNYGSPLVAPFAPIIYSDLKDGLIKSFVGENPFRPKSILNTNRKRLSTNLIDKIRRRKNDRIK